MGKFENLKMACQMRNLFIIITLLTASSVFGQPMSEKEKQHRATTTAIEIEAFKEMFRHNTSVLKDSATFYYISVEDTLSANLKAIQASFKAQKPGVRLKKEYDALDEEYKSKIKFLSFHIGMVKLDAKRRATVHAGYFANDKDKSSDTIKLKKKFGKWKIVTHRMESF